MEEEAKKKKAMGAPKILDGQRSNNSVKMSKEQYWEHQAEAYGR